MMIRRGGVQSGVKLISGCIQTRRSVYIASRRRTGRAEDGEKTPHLKQRFNLSNENKDLENRIKQIQAYSAVLKRYIDEKDEKLVKLQAAQDENLKVDLESSEEDLDMLERGLYEIDKKNDKKKKLIGTASTGSLDGVGLFANPASSISLPQSILSRLGRSIASISSSSSKDQNWSNVIMELYNSKQQLKGLSIADVDLLIQNIPLDQRSSNQLIPIIHEMMTDANIKPSKLTLDLTMASYAHKGKTAIVNCFMKQLVSDGFTPDVYTYGHVMKSLAKNSDLKTASLKLQEMQSLGIKPSLEIYTTVLQTCIRVNDYDEAFRVFDLLKYMSLETQPDIRIYNSLLLAAAKQHNIEKVLDLLKEMTTRPINPLKADAETYNTLIFACARDKRTHLQAWKYLIEMQERGFQTDRKSINALMYLCGETGEILLARAMFRQLCSNPVSYPDSFTFNCLLNSYSNYKPGVFSPIIASELGVKIRSSFFLDDNLLFTSTSSESIPPFLPVTMLHTTAQVLAESKAIFKFFTNYNTNMINKQVILTYLKVPYKLGNFKEFVSRYKEETYCDNSEETGTATLEEDSVSAGDNSDNELSLEQHFPSCAVPRNWNVYDLAIKASVADNNMRFAQSVWTERGAYRRTSSFKNLPEQIRKSSDFHFAQSMVELHAKCGEIDQAIKLIRSTIKQFHWKKYQVAELINKVNEIEDTQSIRELTYLLATYHRTEQTDSRFYNILDKRR